MKITIPFFLSLALIVSVITSIATTVTVSQSLDRYISQLNAEMALDRRALGSVRTVTGDGSSLDRMDVLREQSGAVLRKVLPMSAGTQGLQPITDLASGVALTADGWFAFPVSAGLTDLVVRSASLVTGERTFTVDRTLRDEKNGVLYVHATGSAESVIPFARTLALGPGDELYVTDMSGFVDRVRIVQEVHPVSFAPQYDIDFESTWELAGGVGTTGILLNGNLEFVGFLIDGRAAPLHAFTSSLSSALQVQRLAEVTMGVTGIDVTRAQNFDLKNYSRRGLLIATDASHLGVLPEGPADKAGLEVGDMIVAIDGNLITSTNSVTKIISQFSSGDRVTVSYVRDGSERTADLILEDAKDLIY